MVCDYLMLTDTSLPVFLDLWTSVSAHDHITISVLCLCVRKREREQERMIFIL